MSEKSRAIVWAWPIHDPTLSDAELRREALRELRRVAKARGVVLSGRMDWGRVADGTRLMVIAPVRASHREHLREAAVAAREHRSLVAGVVECRDCWRVAGAHGLCPVCTATPRVEVAS